MFLDNTESRLEKLPDVHPEFTRKFSQHSSTLWVSKSRVPLNIDTIFKNTGFTDIVFTEESRPETNIWPQGLSHFYRDRISVRKIEAELSNGTLELRIFSFSSPEDFELAARVAYAIAQSVGQPIYSDSFEGPLSSDKFAGLHVADWAQEQSLWGLEAVVQSLKEDYAKHGEGYTLCASFNGTQFPVEFGYDQLNGILEDPAAHAEKLFEKIRRINYIESEDNIYMSSITAITITDKEGRAKEYTHRLYSGYARTVMRDDVCSIAIGRLGDEAIHVATKQFIELMGRRIEWLDQKFFIVPQLQDNEYEALRKEFKDYALSKDSPELFRIIDNSSEETQEGILSNISDKEATLLALSPVAVFTLVAAADSMIDKKELQAFVDALTHAVNYQNELLRESIRGAIALINEKGMEALASLDSMQVISRVAATVDQKFDPVVAAEFRAGLLELGYVIANASGGLLNRISKEEKAALRTIASLVRVPMEN